MMPLDGSGYITDEVLQLLVDARARVEQGWCKNTFTKIHHEYLPAEMPVIDLSGVCALSAELKKIERREYCILGAIFDGNSSAPRNQTQRTAMQLLRACLPPDYEELHDFNDATSTQHEEVIDLFDRGIAFRKSFFA